MISADRTRAIATAVYHRSCTDGLYSCRVTAYGYAVDGFAFNQLDIFNHVACVQLLYMGALSFIFDIIFVLGIYLRLWVMTFLHILGALRNFISCILTYQCLQLHICLVYCYSCICTAPFAFVVVLHVLE